MNQQNNHSRYDPGRLLDNLKERLHLKNDRELSQELHMSPKLVGKIRDGELMVSASMLLWIAELAQASIEELRGILGDRRAKSRMQCAAGARHCIGSAPCR